MSNMISDDEKKRRIVSYIFIMVSVVLFMIATVELYVRRDDISSLLIYSYLCFSAYALLGIALVILNSQTLRTAFSGILRLKFTMSAQLRGISRSGRTHILCCLMVTLLCYLMLRDTLRPGFPRDYLNGTVAFYIAKVNMILQGFTRYIPPCYFLTSSWYCVEYPLLRFYPPLSTLVPLLLAKILGNVELTYNILCFLAYTAYCLGVYCFSTSYFNKILSGLIAAFLWSICNVNLTSFQGMYWEATRELGDAVIPWTLLAVERYFQGHKKGTGITIALMCTWSTLSNTISMFEELVNFTFYTLVRAITAGSLKKGVRLIGEVLTYTAITTAWWLIPAIIPYGISGYLVGPPGPPRSFAYLFLNPEPKVGKFVIQLPLTLLGLIGLCLGLILRCKEILPLGTMFVLWVALIYSINVQWCRLIPMCALFLALLTAAIPYSIKLVKKGSLYRAADVISLALTMIMIAHYLPYYSSQCVVDYTVLQSDEYSSAVWLWDHVGTRYRVYVMYGDHYKGSQRINTFRPGIRQVLGGFDQGIINMGKTRCFEVDAAVKWGDTDKLYRLCKEFHIRYIAIDSTWMRKHNPEGLSRLMSAPFLKLSIRFKHCMIFEVKGVSPLD